ncbi:MAG: hypothetical protein H6624_03625 [Bdellovibrionaceae bacterium]|nr:hypothetical protein [Bdellovibrionales bacterium]MCB9083405.1 hypothetical protein [Pseudobdellovibrionaceae bacterium]
MKIANRVPLFAQIFMALWMGLLALFTYVFYRDGGFPGQEPFAVSLLFVFWVFGLGGCGWAFSQPLITVVVDSKGVTIFRRHLWWVEARRASVQEVAVSDVIETTDSEGDPYFKCTIALQGDGPLVFVEAHDRQRVESRRLELITSLNI